MPIYEYQCPNGHRFEVIQKFDDPSVEVCTECGEPVERLISSPAIQFKGSGWYVTDYARKGGDSSSESSSKPTSTDSSKSSETKSEPAKPAASTDKKDS
ncbi:MAG TPA: FmdB family zinc ribbon protein [Acidobacteriota bacterium]|jgi:putative FmdB family regulatory protein